MLYSFVTLSHVDTFKLIHLILNLKEHGLSTFNYKLFRLMHGHCGCRVLIYH